VADHATLGGEPMDLRNGPTEPEDIFEVLLLEYPDATSKGAALCIECLIPLDERDPDDPHCPFCGARFSDPLQALTWAELEAIEQAWPEALEARAS
jgi:hypothetical protein